MKYLFAALLLPLLFTEAQAEPQRILAIHCEPPCRIEDGRGQDLGPSGKPLQFSSQNVQVLRLVAEGYETLEIALSEVDPKAKRWPVEGKIELRATRSYSAPIGFLLLSLVFASLVWRNRSKGKEVKPSIPKEAPEFELCEQIGSGGTSLIFRANSSKFADQDLAIKILKPELAGDPENRKRFNRSLKATGELRHPNLIKRYSSGENPDGSPYLLMERLEGFSLEAFLKDHPRPDLESIRRTLIPLCDVLAYLHDQGVIHRDVKPDNIFVTTDGRVKLMDLETSKTAKGEDLTKTGVAIGTPNYIAPEQAKGYFCPQSDQYAFGVILFEMLTGKLPFEGPDAITVIRRHIETPAPSLTRLVPGITLLQEALTHRLLNKRAEQRFKDMREVKEALLDALSPAADDATATSV